MRRLDIILRQKIQEPLDLSLKKGGSRSINGVLLCVCVFLPTTAHGMNADKFKILG